MLAVCHRPNASEAEVKTAHECTRCRERTEVVTRCERAASIVDVVAVVTREGV